MSTTGNGIWRMHVIFLDSTLMGIKREKHLNMHKHAFKKSRFHFITKKIFFFYRGPISHVKAKVINNDLKRQEREFQHIIGHWPEINLSPRVDGPCPRPGPSVVWKNGIAVSCVGVGKGVGVCGWCGGVVHTIYVCSR